MVEGLARVTALLPAPEAAKAGQRLIGPFLQAAQTDVQTNPGDHLDYGIHASYGFLCYLRPLARYAHC